MKTPLRTLFMIGTALALASSFGFAQRSLADIQESGQVTISTANEIPYGWVDDQGVAHGIAPDVAEVVLANMGITEIEWTVTDFGSLIPGLLAGRSDLVAASQAVLPARCEQVDFSKINSSYGEGFLVEAGNPKDIHSYQDFLDNPELKLGIVSGADQLDFAQALGIPQDQLVMINANADAPSAVTSGRIDAYGATGLSAAGLAASSDRIEVADPFEDPVVDGEAVRSWGAFTFNADSDEFREAFDEELAAFHETQEYRDILLGHGLSEQDIDSALAASTDELCSAE